MSRIYDSQELDSNDQHALPYVRFVDGPGPVSTSSGTVYVASCSTGAAVDLASHEGAVTSVRDEERDHRDSSPGFDRWLAELDGARFTLVGNTLPGAGVRITHEPDPELSRLAVAFQGTRRTVYP